MANREAFVAGEKPSPNISDKKYVNDLRTGDKIDVYMIDDPDVGEEIVKATVLFTTQDAIAIRHPSFTGREIVIFDKAGNEVDPDEDESPMRIKFKDGK